MTDELTLFRIKTELTPTDVQREQILYRVHPAYIEDTIEHANKKIQANGWNLIAKRQSCVSNQFVVKYAEAV